MQKTSTKTDSTTTHTASASATPTTVEQVLGAFTEEAIKGVTDGKARAALRDAHAFASAVAAVHLAAPGNAETDHLKAQLASVHITLEDAVGVAADAVTLIEEIADRDAKENAYHVAVAHVQEGSAELGQHLSSYTLLLRGKLGAKSPTLTQFGVKPLAPGGRRARKAAGTTEGAK